MHYDLTSLDLQIQFVREPTYYLFILIVIILQSCYTILQSQTYHQLSIQIKTPSATNKINMISLTDDIAKLDKLAQTLNTQGMTLDERFMGGGLNIQDLLQQNSSIIHEMRKMKDVFLNYCKLNQKVYNKILEHQSISGDQLKKIVSIENSIDHKIRNVVDDFEIAQEKMKKQHVSMNEEFEIKFKSLSQQLKFKVDQQGFCERIKSLIEEYDSQPTQSQPFTDNEQQVLTDNDNQCKNAQFSDNQASDIDQTKKQKGIVDSEIKDQEKKGKGEEKKANKKSKRGITIEDINRIKDEITPLISEVSNKVMEQDQSIDSLKTDMAFNISKIAKVNEQKNQIDFQLEGLRKSCKERFTAVEKADEEIIKKLEATINEQVWTDRFNQFNEQHVQIPIKMIYGELSNMAIQSKDRADSFKKEIEEINRKLSLANEQINIIYQNIENGRKEAIKLAEDMTTKHDEAIEIFEQMKKDREIAERHMRQQFASIIKGEEQGRISADKQLKNMINSIVENTEVKVMKKVETRFSKQLKEIRSDIVVINQKKAEIKVQVEKNADNISNLKDTVSKKANYSDLLDCLDRKADKSEYKNLEQIIKSPSSKDPGSGQFNNSFGLQKKLAKGRSALITKKSSRQKINDDPGKILNFGWDDDEHNNREDKDIFMKNFKEKITKRYRSQRPSTANTIFLL